MVKLAQLIGTHYRYDDESAAVWRSARTRLLWVGTLSSVAFVALYIVAVTTKSGQYFDNAVLAGHKVQDSWFRWAILRRAARHAVLPLAVGAFAAFAIAVYRRRYHPAVVAAAVVATPDEKWGEVPCAFLELREGASVSEEEIIEFCRQNMARFKVPKRVIFNALPRTSTGKIQKYVLRQQASVRLTKASANLMQAA